MRNWGVAGVVVPLVAAVGGVSLIIVIVSRDGGVMAMIVMAVGLRGRSGGVVIVTMACVLTMAGVVAVIIVRLVLVAHCDSVPQPLSAVFAAKSV